jgi:hypothetical protein
MQVSCWLARGALLVTVLSYDTELLVEVVDFSSGERARERLQVSDSESLTRALGEQ